jgi:hypothetical protein
MKPSKTTRDLINLVTDTMVIIKEIMLNMETRFWNLRTTSMEECQLLLSGSTSPITWPT